MDQTQAHEIQARLRRNDTAVVHRLTVLSEDGEINPRESRLEPGAPDDVRHIETSTIHQYRQSARDRHSFRHALDTSRREIRGLSADERHPRRSRLTQAMQGDAGRCAA
jgi:hypothetical protein